uniref:Uncharacterized protein n=1 Tax=Rhizophora mucronata TaxID=61149 RepID=A0A2P2Q281_RHIMU
MTIVNFSTAEVTISCLQFFLNKLLFRDGCSPY